MDCFMHGFLQITRRFQNAHAYVNAAIMLKTNASFTVEEKPRIVFGGISAAFVSKN